MPNDQVNTIQLQAWAACIAAGDRIAGEDLFRAVCNRLERLARKMLKQFPAVQNHVQTDDVLQNSLIRLLRALREIQPNSVRDFFGLAAQQMRRELLDMARHFRGVKGAIVVEVTPDAIRFADAELEKWTAFHEGIEQLDVEEREVVGLTFYHGWTQQEIADLFQVSVRTIQRWWESALLKLRSRMSDT